MLADGSQLDLVQSRVGNIVKAGNRDILRNSNLVFSAVVHKTERKKVIGKEKCGGKICRILSCGEKFFSSTVAGLHAPVQVKQAVFFFEGQLIVVKSLFIAQKTLIGGGRAFVVSGEKTDAFVPQSNQMPGGNVPTLEIIGHNKRSGIMFCSAVYEQYRQAQIF